MKLRSQNKNKTWKKGGKKQNMEYWFYCSRHTGLNLKNKKKFYAQKIYFALGLKHETCLLF
jgi:hypothetical protein